MGGHQIESHGSGDDGYDEDGYDESQRAEILEATRDGPTDGAVIIDLDPDLGLDDDEPDDLRMADDELGEECRVDASEQELAEDEAQDDFDDADGEAEDADADPDDEEDVALRP